MPEFRSLILLPFECAKIKESVEIRFLKESLQRVNPQWVGFMFHGFKLHIIINDKGELLSFAVTQANVDDREPLKNEGFLKEIFGKLFADKGYISEKLQKLLFIDGIELITSIRNNMKNSLMSMSDKILLRKRSVIETVNL